MFLKHALLLVGFLVVMFLSGLQNKRHQPNSMFPVEWFIEIVGLSIAIVFGGNSEGFPPTTTPLRLVLGAAVGTASTVALLKLNRRLRGDDRKS
jgi:hypothetical protein